MLRRPHPPRSQHV